PILLTDILPNLQQYKFGKMSVSKKEIWQNIFKEIAYQENVQSKKWYVGEISFRISRLMKIGISC
ncbi:6637_t:CDS:1, partial [Racocetra persica]